MMKQGRVPYLNIFRKSETRCVAFFLSDWWWQVLKVLWLKWCHTFWLTDVLGPNQNKENWLTPKWPFLILSMLYWYDIRWFGLTYHSLDSLLFQNTLLFWLFWICCLGRTSNPPPLVDWNLRCRFGMQSREPWIRICRKKKSSMGHGWNVLDSCQSLKLT